MRIYRHLTVNDVQLEEFPFRRELSMEAYLIDNEGVLALDDDVFNSVEVIDAEISLPGGQRRKNADGRIDMLATYSNEYIAIIELKHKQLDYQALRQLEDYLLEREQVRERYKEALTIDSAPIPKWIGLLVGSSIDPELAGLLQNGHKAAGNIPIAALTMQRFRGSDGSVLIITDTFFAPPASKDTTKFEFEGRVLGKGPLVLAVIKRYVELNPGMTLAQLKNIFPKRTSGSAEIVASIEEANIIYARGTRRRHFLKSDDIIELQDGPAVVSNQWGIGNIFRFVEQARKLNFVINPAPVAAT